MYGFSMAPASVDSQMFGFRYDTLELGKKVIGYIEPGLYQDYRYFIMDQQADFQINMKRIPGRGRPILFVQYRNSDGSTAARRNYFHQSSSPVNGEFHTQ